MMRITDILIAANLVTAADVEAAVTRQIELGGRLADHLVELGAIDRAALDKFLERVPPDPATLEETGIDEGDLLKLLAKLIYVGRVETIAQCADAIKLPHHLVSELVQRATERHLLGASGSMSGSGLSDTRYSLTEVGRGWAAEALSQSQYTGPAPVSLDAFTARVHLQKITDELVTWKRVQEAFSELTIDDAFVDQIGPAVNSGRAILLYGPPGNGKTSIALKLGKVFNDVIYVPYAVMVEGQIMRVFDPSLHVSPAAAEVGPETNLRRVRREEYDARWVPCRRPFVVTGGELTLEMLDLSYNTTAQFYEAPLHVKALGGCFFVDDFGRQLVSPASLLNRWVVPLENRVDYLKLQTGKTFALPFEELVIFSTNLNPEDLMDPAFLRRIPYKLEVAGPTREQFRRIFEGACQAAGMSLTDDVLEFVIASITEKKRLNLAAYHPKFIVDQVLAACRFMGLPPHFEPRLIEYAINNVRVHRFEDNEPQFVGAPAVYPQASTVRALAGSAA